MIDIKEKDIQFDSFHSWHHISIKFGIGIDNGIKLREMGKQLKQQIQQDHELRKKIVDLADIWDGKESERYGKQLEVILNDLGIKDIPEFYSKENMDKFIKELDQDRKDRKDAKKWRTWTDNKETALEEYLENRQIVKRLEEQIKELETESWSEEITEGDPVTMTLSKKGFKVELKKILEGKTDTMRIPRGNHQGKPVERKK